jgi:Spy/CpxP family protein refolding chaperone
MKRLLHPSCLLALALGLSPFSLLAQDAAPAGSPPPADAPAPPPPRRPNAAAQIQRIKEKLSLTDDQVTQITKILQDLRTQGMALRQDTSLSDDDRRMKMQAMAKDLHDKVRALLTADQQKIFDTMPPMTGGGRRPPPPPPAN